MENLLSSFKEDKNTTNLIKIKAKEFIEVQHKSEKLGPLIQKRKVIVILNDRNGSSYRAIKKYISSNFNVDEKQIAAYIKLYIYTAVASGIIIHTKGKCLQGSFRLGGNMKLKMSELLKFQIVIKLLRLQQKNVEHLARTPES
ncbi:late histone H1 [Nephila pilipes]|uniref:Late histone H1 n=1 Tax=Nephila pilipes TaxID=299642 RepID=A0A8X6NM83_NEPPI|nr:late histone H1 [Nephila pilipes]